MVNNSVTAAAMEKSLGALWQRQQLISNNIANEDTPHYKAKRISFESALKKEIDQIRSSRTTTSREGAQRIASLKTRVYEDGSLSTRADGNNVNIDSEQIESARVQLQYDALQQRINGHYSLLKYAITGGR